MGNRVRFMSKWKTIQLISRKIQRVHSSGIFKKKPDSDDFQTSFN